MDPDPASHAGDFPTFLFKRVASHESYPMNLIGMMTYGDFDMTVKKRSARSVEDFYETSEIYMILSWHPIYRMRLRHTECGMRTIILSYLKDDGFWDRIPCMGFSHFPIPWILSGWWHMEMSIWLWKNGRAVRRSLRCKKWKNLILSWNPIYRIEIKTYRMRYENCHTFLSKRQWILSPHPMQGIFPLSYFKRVASHE